LGFTGQEEDDDLGLVNMNGRIYDPALARFLMPDPLVSMRSPSQSWNRYSYADNSPLRFVDPSGLDPEDESGNNGAPPGSHLDCNVSGSCGYVGNATGVPVESCGWAGSSANNAIGANVGSFDESGAGASTVTGGWSLLSSNIAYNDIDDPKQAIRRIEVNRNQGDYEASLLKVLAKLTGIDMGDASVRRVSNVDQLAATLAGNVIHVVQMEFRLLANGRLRFDAWLHIFDPADPDERNGTIGIACGADNEGVLEKRDGRWGAVGQ
jgi:RHS repeat-associated protein